MAVIYSNTSDLFLVWCDRRLRDGEGVGRCGGCETGMTTWSYVLHRVSPSLQRKQISERMKNEGRGFTGPKC